MQTPPRRSHAEQVRNIFTSPRPERKRAWLESSGEEDVVPLSPGVKIARGGASDSSSTSSSEGGTRVTSDSDFEIQTEKHNNTPVANSAKKRKPAPESIEDFVDMQSEASSDEASPVNSDMEMFPAKPPSSPAEEESSDEWTGDEEFLPRAFRKRIKEAKQQAHLEISHPVKKEVTPSSGHPQLQLSPQLLRSRIAIAASTRSGPLRSPRGSRFRPMQPMTSVAYRKCALYTLRYGKMLTKR